MDWHIIALVGLVVIIAAAVFSRRTGVATPLLLVVIGLVVGLIPQAPTIRLEPELVLAGVLPPLLYSSAVRFPVIDFRRNLRMIAWLSVVMVVLTAVVIGIVVHLIFPDIPLALGIALGAVVSPTDAIAATSIGKRLGLPHRLMTILEGESLVNDATALVTLRTALAAVAGAFSVWQAIGDFALAVLLAVLVGGAVGLVTVAIRARIVDPVVTTAISFGIPFVAYFVTEQLHASGVLAVVVAGLVVGHRGMKRLSVQDRQSEETNWATIQFLLENAVFGLMGLQLPELIAEVIAGPTTVGTAVLVSLVVFGLLIVLRIFGSFVPWLVGRYSRANRLERRQLRLDTVTERLADATARTGTAAGGLERVRKQLAVSQADLLFQAREPITGRGTVVLAWAGMRGVVTLAAAQTIPTSFPLRAELVLVAFLVAVVSLIGFGGTLPFVIRRLHLPEVSDEERHNELAALMEGLVESASDRLGAAEEITIDGEPVDPAVLEKFRSRVAPLLVRPTAQEAPSRAHRDQVAELQRQYLAALRDALHHERSIGAYRTETYARAQTMIDKLEVIGSRR